MASLTGTFTQAQQVSYDLKLAAGQAANIVITRTGSGAFSVAVQEREGGLTYKAVTSYAADQTAARINNDGSTPRYLRLFCASMVGGNSIAYTLEDVSGESVGGLFPIVNSEGTVVFDVSDDGIETPKLTATAATITTTTGNVVGNISGGTVAGTSVTYSTLASSVTALATPSALAATALNAFASTVSGGVLMGFGTTDDVALKNRAGTTVLGVTANTTGVQLAGALAITGALSGVNSLAAGDASLGVDGLAAAQGGAIILTGGTSSTGANAGGAVSLVGGTPGATGVGGAVAITGAAGGATSGKGGAANVTAGAGTLGNAHGGSVILTPGAKHGSGLDGGTFNRGTFQFRKMGTPETATDTASLTDAQMTAGVIVATPTAAAAYTVRTGTQLLAALPTDIVAGDAFDLTIINIGGTGDDITLTVATDITIVGDPVVRPSADSGTEEAGQGTFRFRYTGTTVFVAYRVY